MSDYKLTNRNKIKRIPARGVYEEKVVHEILDAGFIGHVGFSVEGQPEEKEGPYIFTVLLPVD